MKKKIINTIIIVAVLAIICFLPFNESGVKLWLYFDTIDETDIENNVMVYYTTVDSPVAGSDKLILGKYDRENKRVSFRFPAELVDKIQLIRIDFPCKEQTICINGVAVSSGGVIKKNIDPSTFIDENNVIVFNDIKAFDAVKPKCSVYIATGNNDPYIVLGEPATAYIMKQQSRYVATKGLIMVLFLLGVAAYRKIEW